MNQVNQMASPRQSTQVESQLDELNGTCCALEEIVERVIMRLEPIIRRDPSSEGKPPNPENQLVPLADRIRSQKNRIERQNTLLHTLLTSIEL